MESYISISNLNDFIFCPISIYFHNLYGNIDTRMYQNTDQTRGTHTHDAIDHKHYSHKKSILQGIDIFSSELGICGKIDLYDYETFSLIERKHKIKKIYDGYVFQIYAQYYCMIEMGYKVDSLYFYSYEDNKKYLVIKPNQDEQMKFKFFQLINDMNSFDLENFEQHNKEKCAHCIYFESCDRGIE